ncbi:MAG: DUF308 domain-containing protein [Eubacteriales bacterium]|nr:DUF308 domain-containing protein [Eubacteriales bacterium]
MKTKQSGIIWVSIGLFLLVMGLYFLISPQTTLAAIAWLFGLTMLVSGFVDLSLYAARRWVYGASIWVLLDGAIDVLIGLAFLCHSWLMAELLPYLLAIWAAASGVVKLAGGLTDRKRDVPFWSAQAVVGVVLLAFGVAIVFRPMIATIGISAIVAVSLIVQGLMAMMRGLYAAPPRS